MATPLVLPTMIRSCFRCCKASACIQWNQHQPYMIFRQYGDDRSSHSKRIKSSFEDGLFIMKHNDRGLVLSYYTPLKQVLKHLVKDEDDRDDAKILIAKSDKPLKKDTLLGTAFMSSDDIIFKLDDGKELVIHLDTSRSKITKWSAATAGQVPEENLTELENKKVLLMESFSPLLQDFDKILKEAHGSSSKKFKWLGLFLVSAPLGFVGRLTWFEYSWDIMEPFTWCITYAWGIIAFGYYVMTSQEYQYHQVERRMAIKNFCDSYPKSNFDLHSFSDLHKQIKQINEKIEEIKAREAKNQKSN
ncbi:mitochondrial calcium uniporter isoform X2 [Brevipalpus obovatus]|uniref:mitochondrial calcium uniporter isoform X2 n=1 Tax=Brevipalpus obovatus TaxID=246614 RepID=UPI003D9F3474